MIQPNTTPETHPFEIWQLATDGTACERLVTRRATLAQAQAEAKRLRAAAYANGDDDPVFSVRRTSAPEVRS